MHTRVGVIISRLNPQDVFYYWYYLYLHLDFSYNNPIYLPLIIDSWKMGT